MGPSVLFMCCLLPEASLSSWPAIKWRLLLHSWACLNICTRKKQTKTNKKGESVSKVPFVSSSKFQSLLGLPESQSRMHLSSPAPEQGAPLSPSPLLLRAEQKLLPTPICVCLCCFHLSAVHRIFFHIFFSLLIMGSGRTHNVKPCCRVGELPPSVSVMFSWDCVGGMKTWFPACTL